MPGTMYHLSFAENVYRNLSHTISINKTDFFAGNILPDLAKSKEKSHYRKKGSIEGFFVPDLELAQRDLFVLEDSIKLGMYCHLYLDYHFIEEILISEYIWNYETMTVTNPRNNMQWDINTFFSHHGIYGAYNSSTPLLLKNGFVSQNTISSLPDVLPYTGLSVFDSRNNKIWKNELKEISALQRINSDKIFDYNHLCKFIQITAAHFVKEF